MKIYIVAHSFRSLLAIEQAIKNKKNCNLFLLVVPFAVSLKLKMLTNALKVYFDKNRPDDSEAMVAKNVMALKKIKTNSII